MVDVHAAMLRRERREASCRLLQLARGGDWPASSRLVPRDRDVDEALEEVPLFRRRRAPRLLELFVCFEIAAGPNLRQTPLERRIHSDLTFPRGDDPAVWGRSLLSGETRGAPAEPSPDHGRPYGGSRHRPRRRFARRSRRGGGRVSGGPDRRVHEPHRHLRPARRACRRLRPGAREIGSCRADRGGRRRTQRLARALTGGAAVHSRYVQSGAVPYIIAEPCIDIKDRSCVDVCPVDCIHEFDRILIIDPEECIDCGACEPECPVEAIFPEDALPDKWNAFVEINYAYDKGADVINQLTQKYADENNVQNEPID